MRPDKQLNDLEYWLKSREHWNGLAESYFLATASKGLTKEDVAWLEERQDKARDMAYRADLKHQEAQGLIVVYTGRAKPRWS